MKKLNLIKFPSNGKHGDSNQSSGFFLLCSMGFHKWTKWEFVCTISTYDPDRPKEERPLFRNDLYSRKCTCCGYPQNQKIRQ